MRHGRVNALPGQPMYIGTKPENTGNCSTLNSVSRQSEQGQSSYLTCRFRDSESRRPVPPCRPGIGASNRIVSPETGWRKARSFAWRAWRGKSFVSVAQRLGQAVGLGAESLAVIRIADRPDGRYGPCGRGSGGCGRFPAGIRPARRSRSHPAAFAESAPSTVIAGDGVAGVVAALPAPRRGGRGRRRGRAAASTVPVLRSGAPQTSAT